MEEVSPGREGGGTLNYTTHYGITLTFIKFSIKPK
jgi:hypothetical protein